MCTHVHASTYVLEIWAFLFLEIWSPYVHDAMPPGTHTVASQKQFHLPGQRKATMQLRQLTIGEVPSEQASNKAETGKQHGEPRTQQIAYRKYFGLVQCL